jgi:membrane protein implicated in regulation of membrane protease activity
MKTTGFLVVSTLAVALCAPVIASAEQPTDDTKVEASAPAEGEVTRATFTTAVVEREPEDELQTLEDGAPAVAYFTELKGMDGRTVIHRWEYEGEVMGEVAFDVEGPRWRVHSTKQLDPSFTGQWVVKVMDVDGNVLSEDTLQYGTALATNEEPAAAPPAAPAE